MSLQSLVSPKTNASKESTVPLMQVYWHFMYAVLGMMSGAIGVVMAIGVTIVIQHLLASFIIFKPNATELALAAMTVSLGLAWLLHVVAPYIMPSMLYGSSRRRMQVIFIVTILTALLETYLLVNNF